MSTNWFSQLGVLLQQYSGGQQPPPAQVEQHFDQVAQSAPPSSLSDALASAFRSNETPPFADLVSKLFSHSNPDQKAGLLNNILSGLPSGALVSVLSAAGLSRAGQISPQDANRLSPGDVHQIAAAAERHDPSVVERASAFYAQHPFVVKMLGAAALSAVMSHLAQARR